MPSFLYTTVLTIVAVQSIAIVYKYIYYSLYSCNQCIYVYKQVYKSESVDSCVCRHLFRVAICEYPRWIYFIVGKHKMAVAVKVCILQCRHR